MSVVVVTKNPLEPPLHSTSGRVYRRHATSIGLLSLSTLCHILFSGKGSTSERNQAKNAGGLIVPGAFACILLPWKWQPFWYTASILCTITAAMAVANLLLCCDIICKRFILLVDGVEVYGRKLIFELPRNDVLCTMPISYRSWKNRCD